MTDRQTMLREALDAVIDTMTWRDGEGIIHDAEAWRTLVGRIVMATNGDNPETSAPVLHRAQGILDRAWAEYVGVQADWRRAWADLERAEADYVGGLADTQADLRRAAADLELLRADWRRAEVDYVRAWDEVVRAQADLPALSAKLGK